MKKIEIIVEPNGQVRLETRGYTGRSCEDASRFLEEALGTARAARRTPAFHQQDTEQAQQLRRQ